ncbi:MAG: DUF4175 family protein [Candidatus Eisenbacteria bacterium]
MARTDEKIGKRPGSLAGELRRARRSRRGRLVLEGFVGWLGTCLPGLALLFLIALILPPERIWSALASGAALLWVTGTLAWRLIVPLLKPETLAGYVHWLDRRAGLEHDELSNALALEQERPRWEGHPVSRDLVDLALQRARETMRAMDLRRLHRRRALRRPWLLAGVGGLALFAAALFAPMASRDALDLLLAAGGSGVMPSIGLEIRPGESRVEWGESVAIEATVSGRRRPPGVEIAMRRPGGEWMRAPMIPAAAPGPEREDRYSFFISAVKGDLDYCVRARWATSPVHRLSVIHRLQAAGYRKRFEPPAYTGLEPQRDVSATGDLAGLAGTRVTLEVVHRRPGISGRLEFFGSGGETPLRAAEDRLETDWVLTESEPYQVELRDETSGELWCSDTFRVEVVPDLPPSVQLLHPPLAIDVPPEMVLPLTVDCVDDFGLTELALIYGRAGEDPQRRVLAQWNPAERQAEARGEFTWDLREMVLLPGQELNYFLQVTDNDPLRGPKTAETPLATIRFPSLAEMYAQANEERREDIQSLEETLEGQKDLREDLERVAQEMLRDDEISWERQQEVSELLERQEELGRKLEQVRQSLDASTQRMENQSLFSVEILDKVREIQNLVGEIQSDEFHQAIERMQRALGEMDRDALRQAMEQMKVSQEEVSQALDRTLQMLRRLLAEEQLDRALQKLEEMAARQDEINRQLEEGDRPPGEHDAATGENAPRGEQADSTSEKAASCPLSPAESAALKEQQQALERELQALRESLEKLAREGTAGVEDMKKALDEFMKSQSPEALKEQMNRMRQALEQADRQLSLRFGRKIKSDLDQMHSSLSQCQMKMDVARLEQLTRTLYDVAHRMVNASVRQEELSATAEEQGAREMALQEQELLEEVGALRDSLQAVSREMPLIGVAQLRALNEALVAAARARDAFDEGQRSRGVGMAGEAMRAMNAATKVLLEAAASAQSSSCSSSCPNPFNRLQCLSGQQSNLNRDTQQAAGACQTPRLTMGQQEAMVRLAARQEAIRQGMQEMQAGMQDSQQMLGDLQKIIEEMEEVAGELRNHNADRRLIERQERILGRLLTAQRSLRKQDQSEERLSRAGINPAPRPGPGAVDEGSSRAEQLQRAMVRGSQDPVPAEYRRLVDLYLRTLLKKH